MTKLMPYISFVDMVGTKSYADVSNSDYENAICRFHKELYNSAKRINCKIYGYSDNAYIEVTNLNDMIKFMRHLRKMLMKKNLYFNAAIGKGELNQKQVSMPEEGFSMIFTDPATVSVYMEQNRFSGIGACLSNEVVEELRSAKLFNNFCCSVHKSKSSDDLYTVYDVSYDTVVLEDLEFILSDYALTTIVNRSAGRYYITPVISMLRSLDVDVLRNDFIKITEIVMMHEIKSVLCAGHIDEYSWLFLYTLLGRVISLEGDDSAHLNIPQTIKGIIDSCKINHKMIIENLHIAPLGAITNIEKKKLIQYLFMIYSDT